MASVSVLPCFRPALEPDPRPALKLAIVEWDAAATASKDEHAGGDQFVTDMSRWTGIPGSGRETGSFGEDMVTTIRDLAELGY